MNWGGTLREVVFFVPLAGLVVTALFALMSRQTAVRSLAQPALLKLLEEFRSEKFKADNRFVCSELRRQYPGTRLLELPPEVLGRVLSVMHFYDHLALLVRAGIVKRRDVVAFMGNSICLAWLSLEPYIMSRRAGGKNYQAFFEDLAVHAANPSQDVVLRRLRLKKFAEHKELRAAIERDLLPVEDWSIPGSRDDQEAAAPPGRSS